MCYITTLIDLDLGTLFVESPRCKDKLQIDLKSDFLVDGKDEVKINTQRFEVYDITTFLHFKISH